MKKINVIVKDINTLVLTETGEKGDYIDLSSLQSVDNQRIIELIENEKDKIYQERQKELTRVLSAEYKNELSSEISKAEKNYLALESKYSMLLKEKDSALKLLETELKNNFLAEIERLKKENELEKKSQEKAVSDKEVETKFLYISQISELKKENEVLRNTKSLELNALKSESNAELTKVENTLKLKELDFKNLLSIKEKEIENKYQNTLAELSKAVALSKAETLLAVEKAKNEKANELETLKDELRKVKISYEEKIQDKNEEIMKLNFQKSIKNVKQTGEDLEIWCDNEVKTYMQNGFFNCIWKKDTKSIKDEYEEKASKADFILEIYASPNKREEEFLTSIILEMKDENPESINKKRNDDHFPQLEKNRRKKGCKYALLVSNLEMDRPNLAPIYKAAEYEDMYVVRPAYLMTVINLIVSLTTKFQDLLLVKRNEELQMKEKNALIDEFERLKKSYLENPLEALKRDIESISKASEGIKKSLNVIDETCEKIIIKYINEIHSKLEKFEIKKLCKELDKLIA